MLLRTLLWAGLILVVFNGTVTPDVQEPGNRLGPERRNGRRQP